MSRRGKVPQSSGLKLNREVKLKVEQKISASFQYLTTNKQHNFEYFGHDFRAKGQAFEYLLEFLRRLTAKTLLEVSSLRKTDDCGFEQLPHQQIKFKPVGITLEQDAKIHVFRFGSDYRLLGFFERAVLNIIGFDFNYSAYKH